MYLAKINAQYFMLEDLYLEKLTEFNIVVNDHCHNSYNMHIMLLCALL